MSLKFLLIIALQTTPLLGTQELSTDMENPNVSLHRSLVSTNIENPNGEVHTGVESSMFISSPPNSSDPCVKWCVKHFSLETRERIVIALHGELMSSLLFAAYVFWECTSYPAAISNTCTVDRFSLFNCGLVLGIPLLLAALLPRDWVQRSLRFLIPGEVL